MELRLVSLYRIDRDVRLEVTEFLQRVELGMSRAVESWETGSNGFITALEAERKRVDSIGNVLELQRQSIFALQREIANHTPAQ